MRVSDSPRAGGGTAAFWPRPRPRELVLGLLLWVVVSIAASVVLAPIGFRLVDGLLPGQVHFRRVVRRVAQLVALLLALAGMKRLGVRGLSDVGLRWRQTTGRRIAGAAALGFAVAGAAVLIEFVLGGRRLTSHLGTTGLLAVLATAAVVALLEEGFCRGLLVFPFGRLRGGALAAGAVLVSALYATAHFARGGMRDTATDWAAAWQVWEAVPRAVVQYREAWVGLFVTGLALYLLARRQGDAWGAVGAHFGAVVALQIAGRVGDTVPGGETPFFADGLLPGYGMAGLLAALLVLVWLLDRRRSPTNG